MNNPNHRILILGATGMLGSTLYRILSHDIDCVAFGSIREFHQKSYFPRALQDNLLQINSFDRDTDILKLLAQSKPNVIINCVGIIKQEPLSSDYLESLAINALLPHRLAKYSELVGARLIHFSTDCVFLGNKGPYKEDDLADANDLYGRSKLLGEVRNCDSVTLRTSIIGHELTKSRSLVDWFLSQNDNVYGHKCILFWATYR